MQGVGGAAPGRGQGLSTQEPRAFPLGSVSQDARGCCPAPAPGLWLRSPVPTGAGGHAPRPPCLLQAQGRVSKWGGWGSFGRTLCVTFGSPGLGAGLGWSKASAFWISVVIFVSICFTQSRFCRETGAVCFSGGEKNRSLGKVFFFGGFA